MKPSAEGQVYWVREFAPKGWGRWLGFVEGSVSGMGWQAVVAAEACVIAELVGGSIGVDDDRAGWGSGWRGCLLMIATVSCVGAFDIFAAGHLRIAEGIFATCRIFAYVPVVVTLWVMVSPKMAPGEVFGDFRDYTGSWPSAGLSVLVGQVTGMFVNCRSDALALLAEEVEDADVVLPRGMLYSYLLVSGRSSFDLYGTLITIL